MPAGMGWAGDGLAQGTTNTVTVLLVAYSPRALAAGLTNAELDTAAMPLAGGDTLIRVPGVVIYAGGCGGSDAITVNGKEQPRLWDLGTLTAAVRQLLHLAP